MFNSSVYLEFKFDVTDDSLCVFCKVSVYDC